MASKSSLLWQANAFAANRKNSNALCLKDLRHLAIMQTPVHPFVSSPLKDINHHFQLHSFIILGHITITSQFYMHLFWGVRHMPYTCTA